jgi:hypothetical protein
LPILYFSIFTLAFVHDPEADSVALLQLKYNHRHFYPNDRNAQQIRQIHSSKLFHHRSYQDVEQNLRRKAFELFRIGHALLSASSQLPARRPALLQHPLGRIGRNY